MTSGSFKPGYDPRRKGIVVPAKERFFEYVMYAIDGCWLWLGSQNNLGRAIFTSKEFGVNKVANRVSWMIHKGEIPKGLHVCHSCDNPLCVNPDHLWLGTDQDNNSDKVKKNRQSRLHGESNPAAVLNKEKVILIRTIAWTESARVIGIKFGVSESAILAIWNNKTWKQFQR